MRSPMTIYNMIWVSRGYWSFPLLPLLTLTRCRKKPLICRNWKTNTLKILTQTVCHNLVMYDCCKLKEVAVILGQVVLNILKHWHMTWVWQRCKVSADAKASASSNPWTYNFIFCTGLAGGASQQTNKNTHMKIHIAFMIGRDSGKVQWGNAGMRHRVLRLVVLEQRGFVCFILNINLCSGP